MTLSSLSRITLVLIAGSLLCVVPVHAQIYPSKSIKIIVPFPAGSGSDSVARIVGKDVAESLGQAVVIENKPGAGGTIAAEFVAKSPPDGYTLMVGSNTQYAANVSLYKKLSYNPVTDFAPVARLSMQANALLVRKDFPAKTLAEFVSYAKANPKKLSGGHGASSAQVAIARLRTLAGFEVLEVPYKGIPLAVIDVIGGTVDFTFGDLGAAIAQVKGGRLNVLAVTSATRNPLTPDWPAIAETYPGYDVVGWHAMVAPAGTPKEIRQKLYDACAKALANQKVVDALAGLGITPALMGSDELGQFIPSEVKRWSELIKEAGIDPE
jgi:tripartite-type tricarboxylate transporter receptor subunit TctC